MEFRPIPIILISFYCFLLTLFFFSSTANALLGDTSNSGAEMMVWIPVTAYIIFAAAFATVGIGILYYNQLCWKILFFSSMVGVSTIASFILVAVAILFIDLKLFTGIYNTLHFNAVTWFSFLAFFLSGIIVLYYLTRREILSYFGEMGDLVTPF